MATRLLIVCAIFVFALGTAYAQTETETHQPGTDIQTPPDARLIKRKPGHTETHPTEHARQRPLDDRCKPLKDELELQLQKADNQHRVFQARLAHNAGTRFCREGHADKGIAEFQRGLSYLQDVPH
jgi:hypothetical protein